MGFLGAEHAILQAPLGPDLSCPELVAAVSNAGGMGFLRAPDQDRPEVVKQLIQRTRELTERPFGIGVILHFPHEENIKAALEEKVSALWVFWGEFPEEKVDECHKAGVKVVHQVGSVEEAVKAGQAGVDAIIVQGVEAGGHVRSKIGLLVLLPAVVDALQGYNIPIIAAGGIVDARGYVAALALGAQGVCLGTRFVATHESIAHPLYKRKIVEAKVSDTEYTDLYGRSRWRAPHRVIQTTSHELWKDELPADGTEVGQPIIGHTTIYDRDEEVPMFSGKVPNSSTTGDVENMVMYAGNGVGLIHEIVSAASVVKALVEGAQVIIQQQLGRMMDSSSSREGRPTMV
ncbi:hypothetical protein R1flu_017554 [Riccia fluitans]|uniref:Nitronate monooxygenase domain-containing protein n=1 Tax=Riccia fluitans TaxID=41844 RepID=A0ABD1ZDA2_9MARC